MKFKYANESYDVDVKLSEGLMSGKVNDGEISTQLTKIADGEFLLNIDGRNIKAHVASDKNNRYVAIGGELYTFKVVEDEEEGGADASNADTEIINPPMPGSVVKILVKAGDEVKAGQGLLIMEAMKMETTLYASIDGKVESIGAEEGQQVDDDVKLVVIKK